MFDKWKESIKANKQYQQVNAHVQEHKVAYAVGAGVVGGIALGVGCVIVVQNGAEIQQIIKPKNIMGIGYKSPQIMNTVVLPAKGDPGDVVQNLRTLDTYASKGELAKALNVSRSMITRYFNEQRPDLLGDQYQVIGKGGHPLRFA